MAVAITCLCWYVPVCALQPSEFRKPELGCVGGCLQAPGPDGLRNELWRGSAPLLAGCGACVHASPFRPFRLYKKGPASVRSNYRSIALLNGIAKLWHTHAGAPIGRLVLERSLPTPPRQVCTRALPLLPSGLRGTWLCKEADVQLWRLWISRLHIKRPVGGCSLAVSIQGILPKRGLRTAT